jgi:hypothetical protein
VLETEQNQKGMMGDSKVMSGNKVSLSHGHACWVTYCL